MKNHPFPIFGHSALPDYLDQIHNWATTLKQGGVPSMEFAAPTKCYVVVAGHKMHLNLSKVPVGYTLSSEAQPPAVVTLIVSREMQLSVNPLTIQSPLLPAHV